jgi:hypothetical protein
MRTIILAALAVMLFSPAEAQTYCTHTAYSTFCNQPGNGGWGFGQGLTAGAGALESQARTDLMRQQYEMIEEMRKQQAESAARFESFKSRCFNNGQYIPNCY